MSTTIRANKLNGKEWLKNTFSIWRNLAKTAKEKQKGHPATFPVSLATKILDCYMLDLPYSPIVLDCFAGTGSTLLACELKGYKGLGIDINAQYKKCFEQVAPEGNNLKYITGDARDINNYHSFKAYDICITSPPYWDILNNKRTVYKKDIRPYSEDSRDIGNITDYKNFLHSLKQTFANVFYSLNKGRYFILNIADIRKKSVFYPLHLDAINVAVGEGFILRDIIIWDRQADYNNMRPLGYSSKFIINKVHEYLIVLYKEEK